MRNKTLWNALLVLTATATPALSAPRDDMMAGISRCGGIADDRSFLNCVYGAAQPLRAQLGLPPAPEAQQRLVPQALAAPAPPMLPQVLPQAPPRVASVPQSPPRTALPERAIREHLESFTFDRRGLFIILLGNGEQWRQDPSDTQRAEWNGRASDYVVRVLKDSRASAQMSVMGDPNIYRMVRVN